MNWGRNSKSPLNSQRGRKIREVWELYPFLNVIQKPFFEALFKFGGPNPNLEPVLEGCKRYCYLLIEKKYPKIDLDSLCKDYKTALQEYTQAVYGVTPNYKLISAVGPDHDKVFEVSVALGDEVVATAKGKSKKSAQKEAAKIALEKLSKESNE